MSCELTNYHFDHLMTENIRYVVGFQEAQGCRRSMEDATVIRPTKDALHIGLYDGHSGKEVSNFAASFMYGVMKDTVVTDEYVHLAFALTQRMIEDKKMRAGTTALVAHFSRSTGQGIIANLGDSRAILVTAGDCQRITRDHKPGDAIEKAYIESKGGFVNTSPWEGATAPARLNGIISVSRALGDMYFGDLMNHVPELHHVSLVDDSAVVVMACDGVWDVLSDEQVAQIVRDSVNVTAAAKAIKEAAFEACTGDNVSVVVFRRH